MTPFGVAVMLGIVNLIVVCGNVFVLYILISQKSLHTSTNFIVLSLTVSDFLLGVIVLPFSIFQEYSESWMFGSLWCKTWLALDVLFSTASIYNLLAISFDRWMAVKQPIKYRFISSNRMTKTTIAIVWVISLSLAMPPLIYDHFGQWDTPVYGNWSTAIESAEVELIMMVVETKHGECSPMTSNSAYILFSAFVSFILPMFLMVGLNLSIFHTVADSTKLGKIQSNGCNTANGTMSATAAGNNSQYSTADDVTTWMRVHRGGAKASVCSKTQSEILHIGQRSASMGAATMKKVSMIQRDMIVINTPRPKLSATTRKSTFDFPVERKPTLSLDHGYSIDRDTISVASNDTGSLIKPIRTFAEEQPATWLQKMKKSSIMEQQRPHMIVEMDRQSYQSATSTPTLYPYAPAVMQKGVVDQVWYPAVLASMVAAKRGTKKTSERLLLYPMLNFGRFNLRTELRVARTIGVVVGCFTLCWLPFTIIYVLQAFDVVVPSAMFTIAFWLGYANSAVNPLIYCACSREFRSTIRKVLIDRNNSYSRSF
ncbi:hypothetical protein M3Y95_00778400 [Aphelenchoides besseyi]|nr:hypothetical protein M3Y95_00778400 [Aphelenchoides besseyi]